MRKTKFHILAILLSTMLMLTAFAAPALAGDTAFGTGIQITPPTGWTNRDANVTITITDTTGNGFVRAMVKGEGDWRDITSELEQQGREYTAVLTVSDNCTVTASVTGWDGQTYEKSCSINCFDREAPVLRTSFTAGHLHVEASDTASGVAAVYVDGHRYTALKNGAVDIPLAELGTAVTVQAEDNAGNLSEAVTTVKPSDKTEPSKPVTTAPATVSRPVTTAPSAVTDTTAATPPKEDNSAAPQEPDEDSSSSAALTPDGNMSLQDDISGAASDEKQFVTVTTKNGNYFYLIIDRAADGENTVHFLNQVDEADLLALMEEGTAAPAACSCSDKCAAGAVNTSCAVCAVDMTQCAGKEPPPEPEPEPDADPGSDQEPEPEPEPKKSSKNGILVVVLVVALAGGGAAYFLKFKKKKPDTKGSSDLDDYDYGDEDEPEDEDNPDAEDEDI